MSTATDSFTKLSIDDSVTDSTSVAVAGGIGGKVSALSASIAAAAVEEWPVGTYRPFVYLPQNSTFADVKATLQRAELAFHRFDPEVRIDHPFLPCYCASMQSFV
jgi:hypothetical protein